MLKAAILSLFVSFPAVAADAIDDEPAELQDVTPRCADDVPEADVGMVDLACVDDPEPAAMMMSFSSAQFNCCLACCHIQNCGACYSVYHCDPRC